MCLRAHVNILRDHGRWTRLRSVFSFHFIFMTTAVRNVFRSLAATGLSAYVSLQTAFAQGFAGELPPINGLANGADENSIRNTIIKLINLVLNFLALIAVVVIIIAGIRLIISQGEEEPKEKAKKTIFYAIAGLLIVLFAKVIVGLVTTYIANQVAI